MSEIALKIAEQTNNNCRFNLASIKELIDLLNDQKKEYTNLSYKANGSSALVLKATLNGQAEVALKVMEWKWDGSEEIERIKAQCAKFQKLTDAICFLASYDLFFLGQQHGDVEYIPNESLKLHEKGYLVQVLELCTGSLRDILQESEKNGSLAESLKECLAIQMLDAVNLLNQRHISHGNINLRNFLISSSQTSQVQLKMCEFIHFNSKNAPMNQVSMKDNLKSIFPRTDSEIPSSESNLVSLGIALLELDNIGKFDASKISSSDLVWLQEGKIFENHQINRSTWIYKIACVFLSKTNRDQNSTKSDTVRSMLLLLLKQSPKNMKIPLFSVILKSQIGLINMQIQPKSRKQLSHDYLRYISKQPKLKNLMNFLNVNESSSISDCLTPELLQSALMIMLQWEDYSGEYDVLNVGVNYAVFGVTNLSHNRQSVLKLSLCTNKVEKIKEIGIMRICQTPNIVKFYGHRFFTDSSNNEFVVYELERCKYSLLSHLEQQRITGMQYSNYQKQRLILSIIDSVNFLHENIILHRNINLENFLISEDHLGQPIVKLSNFSHAGYLQNGSWVDIDYDKKNARFNYYSHFNCIISQHKRESPLYFAPEKLENPKSTTLKSEIFSVGLCILLLENYLVFSEEQLAEKFVSFIDPHVDICCLKGLPGKTDTRTTCSSVAKNYLRYFPNQRQSLREFIEKSNESCSAFSKVSEMNNYDHFKQKQTCLHLTQKQRANDFLKFLSTPPPRADFTRLSSISLALDNANIGDTQAASLLSDFSNFFNLSSLSLNLNSNMISDTGAKILLSPLAALTNLSKIFISLDENSIGDIGAESLLVPLAKLINLSSLLLVLSENEIGALGAAYLLSPLANLINLTSLSLSLLNNTLGVNGAKSLLLPLRGLINLSDFSLDLYHCSIRDIGAQNLLLPLANLTNLVSISLDLSRNSIGQSGAQSLLSPLANLVNLSNLSLNLFNNSILDIGAQSLLSPLANLVNLFSLSLNLQNTQLRDIGAQYLLSPVASLINLSSIFLNVDSNSIGENGAKYLLSHLANLLSLSNIQLEIQDNEIGPVGGQVLLSPLANLINISRISLKFWRNSIGHSGATSLFSPLRNLKNLSSISIKYSYNEIDDIGAQVLMTPLVELMNLSKISLDLRINLITNVGALALLSQLVGYTNLSSVSLNFDTTNKQIEHLLQYMLKYQKM